MTTRNESGGRYGRSASAARRSDLSKGITLFRIRRETLLGHVGGISVLVRSGSEISAIGAHCSHYHGAGSPRPRDRRRTFVVPGITPVSICAPAKPPARRRSVRLRCGGRAEDGRIFIREKREQPGRG